MTHFGETLLPNPITNGSPNVWFPYHRLSIPRHSLHMRNKIPTWWEL